MRHDGANLIGMYRAQLPRSFSGQVYDLWDQRLALEDIVARSRYYASLPPAFEMAWVLPHDARPAAVPRPGEIAAGQPLLPALFGVPVVAAHVDRPYLALRPAAVSESADHLIRNGMAQVMAEFDHGTDPYGLGVELP